MVVGRDVGRVVPVQPPDAVLDGPRVATEAKLPERAGGRRGVGDLDPVALPAGEGDARVLELEFLEEESRDGGPD